MVSLHDAGYSWWVNPLAVNDGPDRVWVGSVSANGANRVYRIDRGGPVASVILQGPIEADEHNGVAIAFHPDRPQLMCFYPRHNTDDHLRWQYVERDTMEVSQQFQLPIGDRWSYAQALVDPSSGRVHVVGRSPGGSGSWWYRTSDDWGVSWSASKLLVDADSEGRVYVVLRHDRQNPAVVHMAVGPLPTNTTLRTISYASIDLPTGDIRDNQGEVIGNLGSPDGPELTPTDVPTVVTLTGDQRARLLDVGTQGDAPAVAYAVWDHPDNGTAVYRVARLSGGSWSSGSWSVAAGAPFWDPSTYLGGVALDVDGLVLAREAAGVSTIERWARAGATYQLTETVASHASIRLLRPYLPDRPGFGRLMWQRMHHYSHYENYLAEAVMLTADGLAPDLPDPELPPSVAPVAHAEIRTEVTWLACDAVTGRIIAEVPDVVVSDVSRLLGAYTSTDAVLPIPTVGPRSATLSQRARLALQASLPARTMIVAVINDLPAWAGLVVKRVSGWAPTIDMSLVTLEGYFDRRIVRDLTFGDQDQSLIVRDIFLHAEDIAGVGQGLGFDYDVRLSGITRDRSYLASDRATIYRRARELMGVIDGPEWTVDLDWADASQTAIRKIVRIAPRIGVEAAEPAAVFETTAHGVFSGAGSSSATYRYIEDYSDGKGANWVEAYAPGEGEDQPSSAPAFDLVQLDAGVPIFERHWQPSSSIETQSVLDDHAVAELGRLRFGARVFEIIARWDASPRYGVDWRLGDDIAWDLVGHAHPDGIVGQGRCIGWSLDMGAGLIRPKLLDPTAEGAS